MDEKNSYTITGITSSHWRRKFSLKSQKPGWVWTLVINDYCEILNHTGKASAILYTFTKSGVGER